MKISDLPLDDVTLFLHKADMNCRVIVRDETVYAATQNLLPYRVNLYISGDNVIHVNFG